MRSDLNEIAQIDQYLFRHFSEEEGKRFEAQLLMNNALAEKVEAQRLAHRVIRLFSRKKERDKIEGIYRQLLEEPAFAHQLKTIFF
jgi:alanine-alpha-ketoisovalerate/valine-pyruvate aminotransferase